MLRDFNKYLARKKQIAIVEAIASLLVVVSPILAIACWKYSILGSILFIVLFVATFLSLLLLNRSAKEAPQKAIWKMDSPSDDVVFSQAELIQLGEQGYGKVDTFRGKRIRLLVQEEDPFIPTVASKNRKHLNQKFNKLYPCKQAVSLLEGTKMLRINLVICREENDDLIKWVQQTKRTLFRTEIIVNMALATNSGKLLIPSLNGHFDYSALKRYEVAVAYIQLLLHIQ